MRRSRGPAVVSLSYSPAVFWDRTLLVSFFSFFAESFLVPDCLIYVDYCIKQVTNSLCLRGYDFFLLGNKLTFGVKYLHSLLTGTVWESYCICIYY